MPAHGPRVCFGAPFAVPCALPQLPALCTKAADSSYFFPANATLSARIFAASAGLPNESYSMIKSLAARPAQNTDGVDCFIRMS